MTKLHCSLPSPSPLTDDPPLLSFASDAFDSLHALGVHEDVTHVITPTA